MGAVSFGGGPEPIPIKLSSTGCLANRSVPLDLTTKRNGQNSQSHLRFRESVGLAKGEDKPLPVVFSPSRASSGGP
jgi:hypothetical protein